jgi:hypothetical protein
MEPQANDSTDTAAIFNLDLSDDELVRLLKQNISDTKSYWEGRNKNSQQLKQRRDKNRRYWQGHHYDNITLYDHETEFVDNRIFVDIETTIPLVTANIATPQVMPADPDNHVSIQAAGDLEKVLFRLAEINNLDKKMEIATRDDLLSYVGVLKVRFDPDYGKQGEILVDVVDPSKITIDHNVDLFGEPRFIAEDFDWDIVELIRRFPDKKAELLDKFKIAEKDIPFSNRKYKGQEVHFTYYDKADYKQKEGVAWFIENNSYCLGKMETPNWIPETDPKTKKNFFDRPMKPYIFVNYINSGRKKIDDNAPIDHAIKQNDILNKRGRQIMENADYIQGGIVYNTEMISTDDMAKLVGAPDEKVGVTGNVNEAFARVAPPILPNYVENQLVDARNNIDEYFATHNVTRGQDAQSKTLGQDVLQKNQDFSRHDKLVEAVEDGTLGVYKMFAQFIKVYYDQDHYIQVSGENGQFDSVVMNSMKVEEGQDVIVQKGSTAPVNKEQNRQDIIALADRGMVDPYTAIEVLQTGIMPSPQKIMQRLTSWIADKANYLNDVKQDEMDRQAAIDIAIINRGVMAEPRPEPTPEYLQSRNKYIASGEFMELPSKIQQLHLKNLQLNKQNAQRMLSLKEALTNDTAQTIAHTMSAANAATAAQNAANPDPNAQFAQGAQGDPNADPGAAAAAAASGDPAAAQRILSAVQPGLTVVPSTAGAGRTMLPTSAPSAPQTATAPAPNPTSQAPNIVPMAIAPR